MCLVHVVVGQTYRGQFGNRLVNGLIAVYMYFFCFKLKYVLTCIHTCNHTNGCVCLCMYTIEKKSITKSILKETMNGTFTERQRPTLSAVRWWKYFSRRLSTCCALQPFYFQDGLKDITRRHRCVAVFTMGRTQIVFLLLCYFGLLLNLTVFLCLLLLIDSILV